MKCTVGLVVPGFGDGGAVAVAVSRCRKCRVGREDTDDMGGFVSRYECFFTSVLGDVGRLGGAVKGGLNTEAEIWDG